eukprot:GHVH01009045.1.p1 GENE.GHVH01009045.1~~GHVH01009045.1.p1  ORF type:complete len:1819 (+),score=333.90 GHVH01009045.1:154-5457(+)
MDIDDQPISELPQHHHEPPQQKNVPPASPPQQYVMTFSNVHEYDPIYFPYRRELISSLSQRQTCYIPETHSVDGGLDGGRHLMCAFTKPLHRHLHRLQIIPNIPSGCESFWGTALIACINLISSSQFSLPSDQISEFCDRMDDVYLHPVDLYASSLVVNCIGLLLRLPKISVDPSSRDDLSCHPFKSYRDLQRLSGVLSAFTDPFVITESSLQMLMIHKLQELSVNENSLVERISGCLHRCILAVNPIDATPVFLPMLSGRRYRVQSSLLKSIDDKIELPSVWEDLSDSLNSAASSVDQKAAVIDLYSSIETFLKSPPLKIHPLSDSLFSSACALWFHSPKPYFLSRERLPLRPLWIGEDFVSCSMFNRTVIRRLKKAANLTSLMQSFRGTDETATAACRGALYLPVRENPLDFNDFEDSIARHNFNCTIDPKYSTFGNREIVDLHNVTTLPSHDEPAKWLRLGRCDTSSSLFLITGNRFHLLKPSFDNSTIERVCSEALKLMSNARVIHNLPATVDAMLTNDEFIKSMSAPLSCRFSREELFRRYLYYWCYYIVCYRRRSLRSYEWTSGDPRKIYLFPFPSDRGTHNQSCDFYDQEVLHYLSGLYEIPTISEIVFNACALSSSSSSSDDDFHSIVREEEVEEKCIDVYLEDSEQPSPSSPIIDVEVPSSKKCADDEGGGKGSEKPHPIGHPYLIPLPLVQPCEEEEEEEESSFSLPDCQRIYQLGQFRHSKRGRSGYESSSSLRSGFTVEERSSSSVESVDEEDHLVGAATCEAVPYNDGVRSAAVARQVEEIEKIVKNRQNLECSGLRTPLSDEKFLIFCLNSTAKRLNEDRVNERVNELEAVFERQRRRQQAGREVFSLRCFRKEKQRRSVEEEVLPDSSFSDEEDNDSSSEEEEEGDSVSCSSVKDSPSMHCLANFGDKLFANPRRSKMSLRTPYEMQSLLKRFDKDYLLSEEKDVDIEIPPPAPQTPPRPDPNQNYTAWSQGDITSSSSSSPSPPHLLTNITKESSPSSSSSPCPPQNLSLLTKITDESSYDECYSALLRLILPFPSLSQSLGSWYLRKEVIIEAVDVISAYLLAVRMNRWICWGSSRSTYLHNYSKLCRYKRTHSIPESLSHLADPPFSSNATRKMRFRFLHDAVYSLLLSVSGGNSPSPPFPQRSSLTWNSSIDCAFWHSSSYCGGGANLLAMSGGPPVEWIDSVPMDYRSVASVFHHLMNEIDDSQPMIPPPPPSSLLSDDSDPSILNASDYLVHHSSPSFYRLLSHYCGEASFSLCYRALSSPSEPSSLPSPSHSDSPPTTAAMMKIMMTTAIDANLTPLDPLPPLFSLHDPHSLFSPFIRVPRMVQFHSHPMMTFPMSGASSCDPLCSLAADDSVDTNRNRGFLFDKVEKIVEEQLADQPLIEDAVEEPNGNNDESIDEEYDSEGEEEDVDLQLPPKVDIVDAVTSVTDDVVVDAVTSVTDDVIDVAVASVTDVAVAAVAGDVNVDAVASATDDVNVDAVAAVADDVNVGAVASVTDVAVAAVAGDVNVDAVASATDDVTDVAVAAVNDDANVDGAVVGRPLRRCRRNIPPADFFNGRRGSNDNEQGGDEDSVALSYSKSNSDDASFALPSEENDGYSPDEEDLCESSPPPPPPPPALWIDGTDSKYEEYDGIISHQSSRPAKVMSDDNYTRFDNVRQVENENSLIAHGPELPRGLCFDKSRNSIQVQHVANNQTLRKTFNVNLHGWDEAVRLANAQIIEFRQQFPQTKKGAGGVPELPRGLSFNKK